MRDGWSKRSLGDVATIYNGNSINAEEKKKRYLGQMQGLPFIATKDVGNDGVIDYENGVRIPNFKDFKVAYPNSVFVCAEGGSAGKKVAFIEREVCFGNKLFALQPKKHLLEGRYLYYFVQSQAFKENFRQLITGTIGGVSSKKFKEIPIILSPLPEQQRIVDLLDQEFAKIDALKANAEKSIQAAKDLFQATLKKELEPKEGWLNTTIGSLCEDVKYGTSKPSSSSGRYTYLRMNNITNDGFLTLKDTKRIDITTEEEEKYLVHKGDILFNRTNSRELVGKTCVFQEEEPMVIAGYIIRLRVKKDVNPYLISFYINYKPVREELRKLSVGAVHQSNISARTIQSFRIALPTSIEEQDRIVDVLSCTFHKLSLLQQNYQKTLALCDDLKQALLRKAFNGEL